MAEAEVECTSCYVFAENNIKPHKENCVECHEEQEYLDKYEQWQQETEALVDTIQSWIVNNRKLKLTTKQKQLEKDAQEFLEPITARKCMIRVLYL